ncbi:hypothetical protein AGOR_G00196930 [Albula goreensis]|uniref:Macrophage-expressed gene 1 protein n=1 Tax=Albula goreensis TaxID=1534307 RepID=A0A8T3CVP6_9TELE|nr:hypothetical protein AGOR_G00196930 [Albula goreensis]
MSLKPGSLLLKTMKEIASSFTVRVTLLALWLCGFCAVPDSSINECKKTVNVPVMGVLPGGGWDNLQNLDMGRVMNMSYSLCQTTEDGAYLLPDEVFTVPQKSTEMEISSELIKTWTDQKSTTARSINVEVSFTPSINGKFSAENQRMKEHQVKEDSYTSRTEVRNSMYNVKAHPGFTLDPTFKNRVTQIAIALENNATRQVSFLSETLVLDYGTHVITSISAGSSLMKEDYIRTSFVKQSNSHSVAFSASASFFNLVDDPTIQKLASTISKAIQCYYTVNTYPGCTKPGSPNYNYQANVDDESCDGRDKKS